MFLKTASATCGFPPPDCAASATLITHANATATGPISFIVWAPSGGSLNLPERIDTRIPTVYRPRNHAKSRRPRRHEAW